MAPRKKKKDEKTFPLKKEIFSILLSAIALFYYLCVFSYSPLDPSLFSSSSYESISNLGGILGAYLAGGVFFLYGGASYFIGLYFIINAFLIFTDKRTKLKFLDFFIFLICATFIAIFLQLNVREFSYGMHSINAGGSLGKILADVGGRYLGVWGVYLFVIFGTVLTFILATKLSLIEALNSSSVIIGKGMGSFSGYISLYFARVKRWYTKRALERKARKANFDEEEEDDEEEVSRVIKINRRKNVEANEEDEYEEDEYEEDEYEEDEEDEEDEEYEDDDEEEYEDDEDEEELDDMVSPDSVIEPRVKKRKDSKRKQALDQMELNHVVEGYQLPSMALLDYDDTQEVVVDEDSLKMSARILESKLLDFSIEGRVTEIHPGPVITMFEFQPAPGVKLSRINSLTDDLSLAMGGRSVRIVAPLPNKAAIGIEIPNHNRETVWLKDIIVDDRFQKNDSKLLIALGKDIEGMPYVTDLQKMPHLLVAGSTGSGKSVSINTMITSILYKARPDEVRLILIDPKMIELNLYEGIPHLMLPVVTDPKHANLALKWAVREMERRYKLLSDVGARNIGNYNKKWEAGEIKNKEPLPDETDPIVHNGRLPFIVIVIDEFADLMMMSSKEVEDSVCRIAQKARAAGIHVIVATQRPSVDVITGIIKANFPSRISFRVTSKHDARTILDQVGAEHLLGMGDMLFVPPAVSKPLRLHGAYISETEITRIVDFLKNQAAPQYHEEILEEPDPEDSDEFEEDFDEYYDRAVQRVCESRKVSISSIQRHFRIGYNRAARIVEQMESQGVVSKPNGQGQREVISGSH